MKNILYLIGLIVAVVLFTPKEGANGIDYRIEQCTTVVKDKKAAADTRHRLEVISQDLLKSNGLTPRRNIQTTNQVPDLRVTRNAERILHDFRLKGHSLRQKVSEYVSVCQTTNYSALLSVRGYHVYALRKIII